MRNNNTGGLSIGQRAYIRKQYREGSTLGALAAKYGVSAEVIHDVIMAGLASQ